MLNNLTNFFNLIVGRRIKTQLEDSDLIAVGTKQSLALGDYKPTAIKFSDLQAQIGGLQTVSVDGVTITGNGTPGNPLVAAEAGNFADTDLTFTGTRNHDTAGNALNVYVDIAYDKGYFDIGPFGSTFGFNRSFHSYGTNSIQGYANNSLIQTLTQTGVGIGTSTPAARLDVRAQGALSTDIAFRVRNSADTRNNFTVNGLGQTRVLSNSFSGNFFTISYVGDTSVERDAFIFTQAVQNAMGQAWTFDAGYNGNIEGFKLKNNLTGNNQGVFAIQANNYCFGTEISVSEGVIAERRVMRLVNGVAPTTSVTDGFKMYSEDIVAGNAAPHFRTENGAVIKLYQQTSTGTETAADIVQYLKNLGLLV